MQPDAPEHDPYGNLALCRALGITPGAVTKVVLTLKPTEPPHVEVHRMVRDGPGVATLVQALRLTASPDRTGGSEGS